MNLQTNQLWVVQEILRIEVQFFERKRRGKLLLIYDYMSSFILCAQFYFAECIKCGKKQLFECFEKYGIPEKIMASNEKVERKFERKLVEELKFSFGISIVDEVGELYQGKCEEFTKAWNEEVEWIQKKTFRDVGEFYTEMDEFVHKWNWEHGMDREEGVVPIERFYQGLRGHVFMEKQALLETSLYDEQQKVSEEGTVQVFERVYKVPEEYVGEWITFWISPVEKKEVYIYDEERRRVLHRCPCVRY